jgi:hypothetical protein
VNPFFEGVGAGGGGRGDELCGRLGRQNSREGKMDILHKNLDLCAQEAVNY